MPTITTVVSWIFAALLMAVAAAYLALWVLLVALVWGLL